MKNKLEGFKPYRWESNPKEKEFHDKFVERMDPSYGEVDLVVFPPNTNYGCGSVPSQYLTDREKQVMISTIQWLGSSVGQYFLSECGFVPQDQKIVNK